MGQVVSMCFPFVGPHVRAFVQVASPSRPRFSLAFCPPRVIALWRWLPFEGRYLVAARAARQTLALFHSSLLSSSAPPLLLLLLSPVLFHFWPRPRFLSSGCSCLHIFATTPPNLPPRLRPPFPPLCPPLLGLRLFHCISVTAARGHGISLSSDFRRFYNDYCWWD